MTAAPATPPPLTARMRAFTTTIFAEMSELAVATSSINLGQGFPDTDGPASLLEDAVAAIRDEAGGANQYPPGPGVLPLREAVAAHQHRFYGLSVDPATEVLVTAGATEAIAATIMALAGPGDEVVTFEPYYDSYAATIALAGATRRTAVLRPETGFALDEAELRAAFTPATKLLLLNTPHNPTGKVFTRAELEVVARIAVEHDVVVVCDEVYEHQTYDLPHVPLATLPGMAERTLTISSAGKTFSVTGWKVGWVHGPAELVAAVRAVKQFLTFVNAGPFQPAVARALALPDSFYAGLSGDLRRKRDLLTAGLRGAGLAPHVPDGTYFTTADVRVLGWDDGVAFCRALPVRAGVVAIPVSAFTDDPTAAPALVRFAFCKRDEVLAQACDRLATADLTHR
jgi:N-succinyldiaminopimelate aminotransferase